MKKYKYIITLALILIFLLILIIMNNLKINDISKIDIGDNKLKINSKVNEDGINILKEIVDKSNNNYNYNISYLEIVMDKTSNIKSFTLSIIVFDKDYKYMTDAYYTYNNNILNCKKDNSKSNLLVDYYSKNNTIENINNKIKEIPIANQIKKSDLNNYVLSFMPDTELSDNTPVFDVRNNKKISVLTKDEYNKKLGGICNAGTYFVIRLNDGSSIVSGQQYLYIFDMINEDIKGDSTYNMEYDYYINNKTLEFTQDYGKTWINTDITENEMNETLKFYRDNKLLANSYFISKDKNFEIAYFYGKEPILKMFKNNNWEVTTFEKFEKEVTKRTIGCSNNLVYVALGTDYSMGSGEEKRIYLSNDFGKTFKQISVPLNGSSHTLIDLYMYDELNGIISLKDEIYPLLYSTTDGGNTWNKINYTCDADYLSDIDSIKKDNNEYIITLGQDYYGTLKAKYKSQNLIDFTFTEYNKENIHTVG